METLSLVSKLVMMDWRKMRISMNDIACFMLGHHKKLEVWDSSGIYGSSSWSLSRLIDKHNFGQSG